MNRRVIWKIRRDLDGQWGSGALESTGEQGTGDMDRKRKRRKEDSKTLKSEKFRSGAGRTSMDIRNEGYDRRRRYRRTGYGSH